MAVITPDTFNPLRSYIGVRLQQGVPLVDADWNEAHDVCKFEVQAFLKWFVGNGVPDENDGFHIAGLNPAVGRDFVIRRGVGPAPAGTNNVERGLRHVGRCLVDGRDVLIAEDLNFRAQPLHVSQGGAATALATALGVPTIAEVPNVTGTVVVHLDVWERLVTPMEDPRLVHGGLGVESCARLKREWVVRARAGTSIPVPGNADFIAGHSYYALATIAHRANVPIASEAVTDQRERRLLMPPATLIEDLFGLVDYRRGQGRPLVNLREAINALLRGDLPGSPEAPIAPSQGAAAFFGRGTFFDATNGLITTWSSVQTGTPQIVAARLSLAKPAAGFGPIRQITGSGGVDSHATLLDTGEMLIVYQTGSTNSNILMKRGTFETLTPGSPEMTVTATAAPERSPFAVTVGGQVLILWHEGTNNTWQFRRYDVATNSFPTPAVSLSTVVAFTGNLHAARDSTNTVWVAFSSAGVAAGSSNITVIPVPPGQPPGQPQVLSQPNGVNRDPFVMVDNDDNVWVFWSTHPLGGPNPGIFYRRFLRATMAWETFEANQVPGTTVGLFDFSPTAISDTEGGFWLFWTARGPTPRLDSSEGEIWYVRHNTFTQVWGDLRHIPGHPEHDARPFVLRGSDGSLWLFWSRGAKPFYRQMFPLI